MPRTATVIAETDMVVEALNRAEFATLLDESPSIARKVLSAVAKRSYDNEPRSTALSLELFAKRSSRSGTRRLTSRAAAW